VKISIVTVAYNAAATIADTLCSVAAQSYPEVEHIVVDGDSKDATREVVARHEARVTHFVSEPDQGIYDAMNKGIALATGDVIGTLNADDQYVDSSVLAQVAKVFEDPMVDACYADLAYVDRTNTRNVIRYWRSSDYRRGLFARGWCPPHPTFFVRREIYERCGTFDLGFHLAADFELMLRFLEIERIRVVYVPKIWVKMRLGGVTNKSVSNVLQQNREILLAATTHGLSFNLFIFVLGKMLNRASQFLKRGQVKFYIASIDEADKS
jgi:glycosyltransferase involved in cell wall biosynthesis